MTLPSRPPARKKLVALVALLAIALVALFLLRLGGRGRDNEGIAGLANPHGPIPGVFDPVGPLGQQPLAVNAIGSIDGVVLDAAGKPVEGAQAALNRAVPMHERTTGQPRPAAVAETSADGRFSFPKVFAGLYALTATSPLGSPADDTQVVLAPGARRTVELRLGRTPASLTGRVLDLDGNPIPHARVAARIFGRGWAQDAGLATLHRVYQATMSSDGSYRLALGPGSYTVSADADGYVPSPESYVLLTKAGAQRELRLEPAAGVFGRVLDKVTRQPIAGARITVRYADRQGPEAHFGSSDNEGNFRFGDLAPGVYELSALAGPLVSSDRRVAISSTEKVTGVELLVVRGLEVSGRLTDTDTGKPVVGAMLVLLKGDKGSIQTDNFPVHPVDARSRPDGTFAFEGVLPGKYRLRVQATDYVVFMTGVDVVDKSVRGLHVRVAREAALVVDVAGPDGRPVDGAEVWMSSQGAGVGVIDNTIRQLTDAAGTTRFRYVHDSQVTVHGRHAELGMASAGPQPVTAMAETRISLKLAPAASVSGTVRYDDGKPADGAIVSVQVRNRPDATTTADGEGRFRLSPLEAGDVTIRAFPGGPGGAVFIFEREQEKTVTVADRELKTGIELLVKRPANQSIRGAVLDPQGRPALNVTVRAVKERGMGGAYFFPGDDGKKAITDGEGAFEVKGLERGTYTLRASTSSYPDAKTTGVQAGATGVRVQLVAGAVISGTVVDDRGALVPAYYAALVPAAAAGETLDQRRLRTMGSQAYETPRQRVYDGSGAFEFTRVAAGAYEVQITTHDGRLARQTVSVAANEKKTGLVLKVERGVTVVGVVQEIASGTPMANIQVRSDDPAASSLNTRTDDLGRYQLTGAAPGKPLALRFIGDIKTVISDRKVVDVPAGATNVDAGVVKLLRGNLEETYSLGAKERGTSGLFVDPEGGKGIINGLMPGSAAANAGLKADDVVVTIAGHAVADMGPDTTSFLLVGRVGRSVAVTVRPAAGGEAKAVTLTLGPMQQAPARATGQK